MNAKTTKAEYSKTAYIADEIRRACEALREVETAPLSERREAGDGWLEAMRTPALIGERASWLISGSYGYGQTILARRAASGRGNKVARFALMLAAFEWRCPGDRARAAWHKLTVAQQEAVTVAITVELDSAGWAVSAEECGL